MQSLSFARSTLAFSELPSLWAKCRQAVKSTFRGKDALSVASAIPPSAPLSSGLDAAAFQRHYAKAYQDRKSQIQQRIFNGWYFYIAPVLIGMVPGKFYADLLNPVTPDDMRIWWIPTLLTQLVITPLLMRYRRKHKGYKRHQVYYSAALEACLKEDAANVR